MNVNIDLGVEAKSVFAIGRGEGQALLVKCGDRRFCRRGGGNFLVQFALALQGVEFLFEAGDALLVGQGRRVAAGGRCVLSLGQGGREGEGGGKRAEA